MARLTKHSHGTQPFIGHRQDATRLLLIATITREKFQSCRLVRKLLNVWDINGAASAVDVLNHNEL
jgi:hypothetical protein